MSSLIVIHSSTCVYIVHRQGSFFDLLRNASELFNRCGVCAPPMPSPVDYYEKGPCFIAYFHPALGPLWDVIEQKVYTYEKEGGKKTSSGCVLVSL